ncbi:MAG: hypothetical protein IPJ65_12220 [Archangiaceae bacterium]|nr:hypothetical protein [Archangiaceae bacterium]
MSALPLLVLLAAVQPLQLALPELKVSGATPAQRDVIVDVLVQQLAKGGVKVTTARDMAAVLGAERQRQLLGCSGESASCMAELAGALGADGLVTGTLALVGKTWVASLSIVDANGGALASRAFQAADDALLDELAAAARALVDELKLRRPERFAAPKSRLSVPFWVTAALGVAAAGTGAGLVFAAHDVKGSLVNNPSALTSREQLDSALSRGRTFQTVGWVLVGAGAVGVAAAVVLALVTGGSPSEVALGISSGPGGAFAVLTGRLP